MKIFLRRRFARTRSIPATPTLRLVFMFVLTSRPWPSHSSSTPYGGGIKRRFFFISRDRDPDLEKAFALIPEAYTTKQSPTKSSRRFSRYSTETDFGPSRPSSGFIYRPISSRTTDGIRVRPSSTSLNSCAFSPRPVLRPLTGRQSPKNASRFRPKASGASLVPLGRASKP